MTGTATLARVPQAMRVAMLSQLARHRAQLDHAETLLLAAMASDPLPYPGDPIACEKQYVREEVAAALRLAPVTAGAKLDSAQRLCARFPEVVAAMATGELSGHHGTRLVELTDELSDDHAAKVAQRVLPRAGQQTISQFCAAVRRAVLTVDPRTAEEKHARSRKDRAVHFGAPGTDGMVDQPASPPLTVVVASQHHDRSAVAITSQHKGSTGAPRTSGAPTPSAPWARTPRRSPRRSTSGSPCRPC